MELIDTNYQVEELEVAISPPFFSFGDYLLLSNWIEHGPGRRKLVAPYSIRVIETKEELSLSIIPLEYQNNRWSRLLIRLGFLESPWD